MQGRTFEGSMVGGWLRLWRLVGGNRRYLAAAAAVAVCQSALLAPLALLVRRMFDTEIPAGDTSAILATAALMGALALASAAVGLLARRMTAGMAKRAIGRLRNELLERLYALPPAFYESRDPGVLHVIVVQDTERLSLLLNQLATSVVPALLVAVALAAVALWLQPLLFTVLAAMLVASVLAARALGERARRLFRRWHDDHTEFSAATRLAIRAMRLSKVQGAEAWELERHRGRIAKVTDAGQRLANAQAAYGTLQTAIASVAGVTALAVGGVQVAEGRMTLGDLLAFYAIGALLLRQINTAVPGLANTAVHAEALIRVEETLERSSTPHAGTTVLRPLRGAMAMEGVSFAYDAKPVLRDIDLAIEAGEHLAIVGPNGSGKSTLVALLLGFHAPGAGVVRADGVPLDELELEALRRQIGVLLQDPVLLLGTVRENVAYGRPETTETELNEALRRAGAAAFVAALPGGLEARIGDEGNQLAGGQGQRIALARALLGDPALLVLDEPTNHLDHAAIEALLDELAQLRATIVTVTHDLEVAARADRIVHLRDGAIVRVERPRVHDEEAVGA